MVDWQLKIDGLKDFVFSFDDFFDGERSSFEYLNESFEESQILRGMLELLSEPQTGDGLGFTVLKNISSSIGKSCGFVEKEIAD